MLEDCIVCADNGGKGLDVEEKKAVEERDLGWAGRCHTIESGVNLDDGFGEVNSTKVRG